MSAAAKVAGGKSKARKQERHPWLAPDRSEQRLDGVPSDGEAADPQVTLAQASGKQAIFGYHQRKIPVSCCAIGTRKSPRE